MRKRVSRILAVTLATAVTVTAMPSEAEAAFRSFDSVPKAVSQAISQAASQKEIRYFPVTLYDYDQDTINQAVYQEDKAENPNSRVLRGIYFSNGAPGSSYATWNTWTGLLTTNNTISSTQTSQKGYVYSGLVGSDMQNGNIHFTVPDGGIFDSGDTKTKEVYTNVGLPFVYENGYYTFDASQDSAYFSGTAASETNLTWNDTAQTNKTDNRKGFYPFNSGTSVRTPDYHFGMIATIPFSMTADGKISSTSDEDIKFEFAGDDDVWVFIDGKLVLDIGGIHDSVNGTINFAQNKTEIFATSSGQTSGMFIKGGRSTAGKISKKVFRDSEGAGIFDTTLKTFAATDQHTLTVYYLERGEGASNCKIKFNLPMKDTVSVHKTVKTTDSKGIKLDDSILAQISQRDFYFTLYRDGEAVSDATYNLYDINNQYVDTRMTGTDGRFALKNGQTAKFIGTMEEDDGKTYYITEADNGASWIVPKWSYQAEAAGGFHVVDSNSAGTSMSVTAKGEADKADQVSFTCENEMLHKETASFEANDDYIVLDYGLPVEIDPLVNDLAVGGSKELVEIDSNSLKYGTAEVKDGKIHYTLTKQLTGVEVLNYTAKVKSTNGVDDQEAQAKVYIIPATDMYYEEDFGMAEYPNGSWEQEGTPQEDYQEPGVVGDAGDSPYGSDVAYLSDSEDSNGSSCYVSTEKGAAKFIYTFTGKGTSFFARTSNNSGYLRIVIRDAKGREIYHGYRNTIYQSENKITLYNIPVFTWNTSEYGTYNVEVSVAKAGNRFGSDFWLDGIRVMQPLDETDEHADIAAQAYNQDGEANMTAVTLRQKLLSDYTEVDENGEIQWDGKTFVVFTDSNGEIKKASEYKSNGPKEEVYLDEDQSVTFSLKDWDPNTNKLYLGVKAPFGNAKVSVNGQILELKNAADCYYEISKCADISEKDGSTIATFEIKAEEGLVSATNIKVTGNAEFTIIKKQTYGKGNGYEENV